MNQSGNISSSTIDPNNLSVSDIDEQIATALNEVFKLLNLKEQKVKTEQSSDSSFETAIEEEEESIKLPPPRSKRVEHKTTESNYQSNSQSTKTKPYQRIIERDTELEVGDRVLILNQHRNLRGATGKIIAVQNKQVSLRLDKEKKVIQRSKKNVRRITK
jgi:hypothetical protein